MPGPRATPHRAWKRLIQFGKSGLSRGLTRPSRWRNGPPAPASSLRLSFRGSAPMSETRTAPNAQPDGRAGAVATGLLVLADGTVWRGQGIGATGDAVGEVCFNTSMTGYQEILTDPSYAGQIITFTFPHIGVVGANEEDIETVNLA